MRLSQNTSFCPISVSDSNFNPQKTQCMSMVKIFAILELEQKYLFLKGLNITFLRSLLIQTLKTFNPQKKIVCQTVRAGNYQASTIK